WVLSAAHAREIKLTIDGGVYPPVTGSRVVLLHEGATESDVELFRIDPYPSSLPRMPIRNTSVRVAERVLMAGHGRNRGPAIAWQDPPTLDGYGWAPGKRLRWGTNVVSTADLDVAQLGMTTRSFGTTFSRSVSSTEAQATNGDSGGPVFTFNGARWELAGIIFVVAGIGGQPPETSIYGNRTFASDLSYYRQQILEVMTPDCGNGHLTIDEQCDDGNTTDGDCCSSTCTFETAGAICDDGRFCNGADTCDDAGACVPAGPAPCNDHDTCTRDTCDETTDTCGTVFTPGPSCESGANPQG
ncbi:MAG: hypothetical protein GY733_05990, partial [bacterium]|nr:hypothetical protein [bacterium]